MQPKLFSNREEIIKTITSVSSLHDFENAKEISRIFYDTFKIAYYAVKRKRRGSNQQFAKKVVLSRREITRLMKLIDYFHVNNQEFSAEHSLTQCFGAQFVEKDALKFFESFVEGDVKDIFGREIMVDLEDGVRFMYKNYQTQLHEMKPEYYLSHRGKRLPWIRHALQNSRNVYGRIDGNDIELMYIARYKLPNLDEEGGECYWVVIAKKYRKDKISPFKFKTAFPVFKYNELLKRLERYQPIIELQQMKE